MSEVNDGDGEDWSLIGVTRRVDQIQVDFRFGLALDDGTLIAIESPFTATIDGRVIPVTPETLDGVGAALALLHRDVSAVRATRSGSLRVELTDGSLIEVSPDDAYESWHVLLPGGSQYIGLPGGDVACLPRST